MTSSNCTLLRQQVLDLLQPTQNFTHVGLWGGSSYLHIDDWVQIIYQKPPTVDPTEDTTTGRCNNIFEEVRYSILTAPVGSVSNPQQKIVGMTVAFSKANWVHSCSSCENDEQIFEIRNTVSFFEITQEKQEKRKAPPLMPPLPSDILYPFYISSSNTMKIPLIGIFIVFGALLL